jgi:hypothetical protein
VGDLRDMAKAELPEAQFPVRQISTPSVPRLKPTPRSASACIYGAGATSGRWTMSNEGIQG